MGRFSVLNSCLKAITCHQIKWKYHNIRWSTYANMVLSALISIECKQLKRIYTNKCVCVCVSVCVWKKKPLVNSRQILHFSDGVFICYIYIYIYSIHYVCVLQYVFYCVELVIRFRWFSAFGSVHSCRVFVRDICFNKSDTEWWAHIMWRIFVERSVAVVHNITILHFILSWSLALLLPCSLVCSYSGSLVSVNNAYAYSMHLRIYAFTYSRYSVVLGTGYCMCLFGHVGKFTILNHFHHHNIDSV